MTFLSFYKEYISRFEREYKESIEALTPASLYDPIHYVLGHAGKQIRPAILSAVADTFGNTSFEGSFPAACCLEMIHNFTLIHDDIMDGDVLRHGHPTVHQKWDVNNAILSGDGLFAFALKQLDAYRDNAELYTRILPLILNAVIQVCEGQAMDMEFENRQDVELDEYLEMVKKKTAFLLANAARVGAVLGSAGINEEVLVEKIMLELGIVFQIQDDLLELTSSTEEMGKTLGSDLIKQKKTFPYLYAKKELPQKKWDHFLTLIDPGYIRQNGMGDAKNLLNDNFIFDRINELITLRHETIQKLIDELPNRSQEMFYSVVEFIMNRKN